MIKPDQKNKYRLPVHFFYIFLRIAMEWVFFYFLNSNFALLWS